MTYLEGVEAFVWVHLTPCCSEAVCCQFLYLWSDVTLEANVKVGMILINIALEF